MRAGVATLQQTLTPDAAAVLKRAAGDAARRGHAQVTPLHVAASLLASPSGLLQQACLQSHRHLQHPLQCRALELCFNVALERLPSAATAAATTTATTDVAPAPLSNALVAALKRAQAHQRRGCPEQQQVPLLAVRVEMEQLVISILDDPSVSRVMREAGFSSTKAKNSLESIAAAAANSTCVAAAAAAAVGSPMAAARSAGGGFFPFAAVQPAAADDGAAAKLKHHQQLAFFQPVPGSIPSRPNPARGFEPGISRDVEASLAVLASARRRRNPILVGDETATGRVMAEVLKRIGDGLGRVPLDGARIISAADKAEALAAVKAIDDESAGSIRLVACLGNLAWCLQPAAASVMVELVRLLAEAEVGKRSLWYVGLATSQTYTRFLAQHPSMETSLGLQPLPVSCTVRPRFSSIEKDENPTLSVQGRLPKMPFRILEEPTNSNADELSCCSDCNAKFEHESLQYQDLSESVQSSSGESFPFWLTNGRNLKSTTQLRPQSQEQVLEVRRKWSRICHILHSSSRKSCFAALPSLLNDSTSSSSQTSSAEGKVDNGSRGVHKASDSWLSLSTAAGTGRNFDSKQDETGLSLGLSPSKSVVTDLSLGGTMQQQRERLQDTSACTRQSGSQATVDEVATFKRLYAGLNDRVPWQNEAVAGVASTVTQCRLDADRRRRGTTAKNDIWLGFTGPDRMGKRRVARGLAELVFGSRDKYALLSLSGQRRPSWSVEEPSSRGKTVLDRLAEVVFRNRSFCVVVLEDFDEADSMVRKSLVKAMERGKLMDSKGREVSLGDAILVLSCSSSTSKSCLERFRGMEDRLLAIKPCSMKVVPGEGEEVVDESREVVVSIVDFMPSGMKQRIRVPGDARPGQKRKARWSEALEVGGNKAAAVDLNLGLGCSSEETRSNKGMQVLGGAASSIDRVVEFKEVDFDELVETVMRAVEAVVLENGLSRLEVDVNCIEAMVTALWEDGEVFQKWIEGSFAGTLARRRGSSVLQLRIDEDSSGGENGLLGPVRECTII